jgi:hypothetical protein
MVYRPTAYVNSDDVKVVQDVVEFLAVVHDCAIATSPARYGGYWLRFKRSAEVYPSALKVASWLHHTEVTQPHLN